MRTFLLGAPAPELTQHLCRFKTRTATKEHQNQPLRRWRHKAPVLLLPLYTPLRRTWLRGRRAPPAGCPSPRQRRAPRGAGDANAPTTGHAAGSQRAPPRPAPACDRPGRAAPRRAAPGPEMPLFSVPKEVAVGTAMLGVAFATGILAGKHRLPSTHAEAGGPQHSPCPRRKGDRGAAAGTPWRTGGSPRLRAGPGGRRGIGAALRAGIGGSCRGKYADAIRGQAAPCNPATAARGQGASKG